MVGLNASDWPICASVLMSSWTRVTIKVAGQCNFTGCLFSCMAFTLHKLYCNSVSVMFNPLLFSTSSVWLIFSCWIQEPALCVQGRQERAYWCCIQNCWLGQRVTAFFSLRSYSKVLNILNLVFITTLVKS